MAYADIGDPNGENPWQTVIKGHRHVIGYGKLGRSGMVAASNSSSSNRSGTATASNGRRSGRYSTSRSDSGQQDDAFGRHSNMLLWE